MHEDKKLWSDEFNFLHRTVSKRIVDFKKSFGLIGSAGYASCGCALGLTSSILFIEDPVLKKTKPPLR